MQLNYFTLLLHAIENTMQNQLFLYFVSQLVATKCQKSIRFYFFQILNWNIKKKKQTESYIYYENIYNDKNINKTSKSFSIPFIQTIEKRVWANFVSFCILLSAPAGSQSAVVPASSSSSSQLRMPPPTSGGINEPQECPYCRRTFSCYYSLKRHFQDKHEQSDTLYVCEFCNRRYRTKNSLTTHKSLQHRGSSGMLKRLLKTSAIKNVLGPHHGASHPRQHLFDFAAELGQPPPGMNFKEKHLV